MSDRGRRYFPLSLESLRAIGRWAADCAERALPLYEARHGADLRPRAAIEGIEHAPLEAGEVLHHMPARLEGTSRLEGVLHALDAGVRARSTSQDTETERGYGRTPS